MIDFTTADLKALKWMFDKVRPMLDDATEDQSNNFSELEKKVFLIANEDVPINITEEDIQSATTIIEELDDLCHNYQNAQTDTSPDVYDNYQKELLAKMGYLGTIKDKITHEVAYLKEVVKEFKARRAMEIREEDGISLTQANTQVERDKLYTKIRDSYYSVRKVAASIKTKYEYFGSNQRSIAQSLKLSLNERFYQQRNQ